MRPGAARARPETAPAWPRAARSRWAAAGAVAALAVAGCGGGGSPATRGPAPLRVTVAGPGLVPEIATGVLVGPGRVLTVAHALDGGGAVRVAGRPARVVRADARLDLAVLAVPGLRGPQVRFAEGHGAGAVAVLRDGRARALAADVRRHVTATVKARGATRVRPALELVATIEPGDSGAPVTDARGRVLGIVFAAGGAQTAWAVDASAARALLTSSASSPAA